MRKIYLLLLLFAFNYLQSQTNLVPNPSFEVYDTCPNTLSQISRAVGWHSAKPSPDYFNSCAPTSVFTSAAVPHNYWGYQYPASGNAYAGFAAKDGQYSVRECLGAQLITPLQIGIKYYVYLKVCLAYNPNFGSPYYCGINKLGALFSTVSYSDNDNVPICNCAQFYTEFHNNS